MSKGIKTKILYMEQLWLSLNLDLNSIQASSSNACAGLAESCYTSLSLLKVWIYYTDLCTVLGGHGTEAAWSPRAHRL